MDMMQIRKMVMGQMASGGNARMATGTFTGVDSSTISINIGFKPDVVYIDCGYRSAEYGQAGWTGCAFLAIFKDISTVYYRHNNNTSTAISVGVNNDVGGIYGEYGNSSAPTGTFYGTFNDGVLEIANKSPTNNYTHFIEGENYTWIAFAKI